MELARKGHETLQHVAAQHMNPLRIEAAVLKAKWAYVGLLIGHVLVPAVMCYNDFVSPARALVLSKVARGFGFGFIVSFYFT